MPEGEEAAAHGLCKGGKELHACRRIYAAVGVVLRRDLPPCVGVGLHDPPGPFLPWDVQKTLNSNTPLQFNNHPLGFYGSFHPEISEHFARAGK